MLQGEAFCQLPFKKIKVSPAGEVRMCCYQSGSLGNLVQQEFLQIWDNALAREVRDATLQSTLHPTCVGWGGCPYLARPKTPTKFAYHHAFPTMLEFDLPNTHCNVGGTEPTPDTACFMCPRADPDFAPHVDRTMELVERLKPLMPYLTNIQVQGTSEPFWKDRVFDVLEGLGFSQYKQKCHYASYTNGTVFDRDRQARFTDLCPNSTLNFSIDAATPATYEKIRRLPVFHRVVENIRTFVRNKGPRQRVEIANNLNLYNLDEAVQMVELAHDLGVQRVQFNPTHSAGRTKELGFDDVLVSKTNFRRFAEAEASLRKRATELGVGVMMVRPLDLGISESSPR